MNALHSVVVALGSNLGDRRVNLRRAIDRLAPLVRVVRLSTIWETPPVDAPAGSGAFLNLVAAGWTALRAPELLQRMHAVEAGMGRMRRLRNEPRIIDLDLILYGASLERSDALVIPHPRYRERAFVLDPLREVDLPWTDPATSVPIARLRARGDGASAGSLY